MHDTEHEDDRLTRLVMQYLDTGLLPDDPELAEEVKLEVVRLEGEAAKIDAD